MFKVYKIRDKRYKVFFKRIVFDKKSIDIAYVKNIKGISLTEMNDILNEIHKKEKHISILTPFEIDFIYKENYIFISFKWEKFVFSIDDYNNLLDLLKHVFKKNKIKYKQLVICDNKKLADEYLDSLKVIPEPKRLMRVME